MFEKMVKMRNKKGFTLMELLIVVAIIAILVAISIPVFTSQLEKARKATDDANLRAAKSVATAMYLSGGTIGSDTIEPMTAQTGLYYDAVNGTLTKTAPTGYGKSADNVNQVINVSWTDKGVVTVQFPGKTTNP